MESTVPKPAILLVNPNPRALARFELMLTGDDYPVITAASGAEARHQLRTYLIDAVWVMADLPDASAGDLVKSLRSEQPGLAVLERGGIAWSDLVAVERVTLEARLERMAMVAA